MATGAGAGYELGNLALRQSKVNGGASDVVEDGDEKQTCKVPHLLNEFNALAVKHAKQRCRVQKGGCCGKFAFVCTGIEMFVPVGLSLLLWLIYGLVDELTVGPVPMGLYGIGPTDGADDVTMPLALRLAGQKIAVVKGESASDADVTALLASLDKSFPGFDLAVASGGACANMKWHGVDGWQYAMLQNIPPQIDPPAANAELTLPKFSDRVRLFASSSALEDYVTSLGYKHDLYAAITLNEAGTAANSYRWRYELRLHTFRGLGLYTRGGNSADPLSPAPKLSRGFRRYFTQGPWQTGVGQTDAGDRGGTRGAAAGRGGFMRIPMPSYGSLQIAMDRAIIDATQPFDIVNYGTGVVTTVSDASLRATAAAAPESLLEGGLGEILLGTVASPVFNGVLGLKDWSPSRGFTPPTFGRRRLAIGESDVRACYNGTAPLSASQRASLAQAYGDLIWAGRGRVPHEVHVASMPGVEYLDPTFYDTLAFMVPIFYILIYLLPVFNQVRAEGALFYVPLYFTRIMLTIWLAPPNIFIYLSRSGARWRRRKRASRKACSSWA
jgi:hypothetical protein